jgi:hypothetical protein
MKYKFGTLAEAVGVKLKPGCRDAFEVMAVAMLESRHPEAALVIAERHGFMDGVVKSFRKCEGVPLSTAGKAILYRNAIQALRMRSLFKYYKKFCENEPAFSQYPPPGYGRIIYMKKTGMFRVTESEGEKIKQEKAIVRAWVLGLKDGKGVTEVNYSFKIKLTQNDLVALAVKHPREFAIGASQ